MIVQRPISFEMDCEPGNKIGPLNVENAFTSNQNRQAKPVAIDACFHLNCRFMKKGHGLC